MSTNEAQPKRVRGPRKRPVPLFITKTEIGNHLGLGCLATIDDWIEEGRFPPAHSWPGERYPVWRRRDWDHYVETGAWPLSAFPPSSD